MICSECGHELAIGDWPYCPHGPLYDQNAQHFDPVVVWQSNVDPFKYSFPGQANEPCPADYHRVELRNMREADRFVHKMNDIERRRLEEYRDMRHALDDAGIRERRSNEDAKGVMNERAAAMRRRVREWTDKLRDERRGKHARIDPQFHINVLSYDSGNRNSYSGPETGWREKKS